ncbi:MAG TPA: DUF2203 domain-containing protein [Thermoplasmata archaeon]|nr:DUF2203 domain-containing protein [Thermoplasmata archaeon]
MERRGPARDPAAVDPPRLWTVDEANVRIEELNDLLPQLRGWVTRLGEVHAELARLADFWGRELEASDHPDRSLKQRLEAEWRNLSHRLEEAVVGLRAEGIEVREVESGLVDFYSLQDGELVFLCWRRGEPSVAHYHTLTEGFKGRRPLPPTTRSPPART